MALTNMDLKTKNWFHVGEEQTVKRGKEKRKKKKRRRGRRWRSQKGMELTLDMNSIMDHMDFVWNCRKDYEFQT